MPEWLAILLAITGGTGILAVIVKDIYGWLKSKTKSARARIKEEKQSEMREVIQSELKPLDDKIDRISQKLDTNTTGTVTILRDTMKKHKDDFTERGWASASDKANWHELYNSYKDLGGNHFREYVNQWRDEVDNLPLEKITSRKKSSKKILVG